MKGYLLYPPQYIPFSPHLAGPTIQSIVKQFQYDIKLIDLNILFYRHVFTTKFLHAAVKEAFLDYQNNAADLFKQCPNQSDIKKYPVEFQQHYLRYQAIFTMAQQNYHNNIIAQIDQAVSKLKTENTFFDPAEVNNALLIIKKACDILSAIYHPSKIYFLDPSIQIYDQVDILKKSCENKVGNIFYRFYEEQLPKLLQDQPEFIGISIGDYSQLFPGLTLTMLLKKQSTAHICIGGNLFSRYTNVLVNNPEFFDYFADTVIFNEGEKPILALLKALEQKINFANVPNLIYLDLNKKVVKNPEEHPLPIESLPAPDFSGLQANDYYLPHMIFNIQASRNCYWAKCSFCTHHFGSRYAMKSVEQIILEIKYLQKNYNAEYFHFVDESVSPAYLKKLAERILEEKLKIQFYIYGRLERACNRELFRLAYQAGLRMILWGFETANERIYSLMNKGKLNSLAGRLKIFEDAYAEGIWNFLFVMFGFPTETLIEAKETVDFLADHRDILSHGTGSTFMLLEDSPILKNLEKYSIIQVIDKIQNGFSFAYRFKTNCEMNAAEKKELDNYKIKRWRLTELQFRESSFREKLFLYLCRYGVIEVSRLRQQYWL